MKKINLFSTKSLLLGAIVLVLLFLAGGAFYWYKEIYLAPGRILFQALENVQDISSFAYEGKFDVSPIKGETIESADINTLFGGKVNGVWDISEKTNIKGTLLADVTATSGKPINIEARTIGSESYIKVDNIEPIVGLDVSFLKGQWLLFNWDKSLADMQLNEDQLKRIEKGVFEYPPIRIMRKLPEEQIGDQTMFHYAYEPNKENVEALLTEIRREANIVQGEENKDFKYLENSTFLPGEIWIGKSDLLVHKFTGGVVQTLGFNIYAFTIEMTLSEYNVPIVVDAPSAAKPIAEVLAEFQKQSGQDAYSSIDNGNSFLQVFNSENQLKQARDAKRRADLFTISNGVYQYVSQHNGTLPDIDQNDSTNNFPTKATCIGAKAPCFNLASSGGADSVVPKYIAQLPFDPIDGNQDDTHYMIYLNSEGRIVTSAKGEITPEITLER